MDIISIMWTVVSICNHDNRYIVCKKFVVKCVITLGAFKVLWRGNSILSLIYKTEIQIVESVGHKLV